MKNINFLLKFLFLLLLYSLSLPIVPSSIVHTHNGTITAKIPTGDVSGDIDSGDTLTVIINTPTTVAAAAGPGAGGGITPATTTVTETTIPATTVITTIPVTTTIPATTTIPKIPLEIIMENWTVIGIIAGLISVIVVLVFLLMCRW